MDNELVIRFAETEDINTIGFLAQQIWPRAYGEIITKEQISYMLNLFYTPDALMDQMKSQKQTFILAEQNEEPIGFASFGPLENSQDRKSSRLYKLHKLYIHQDHQGKGLGKALIDFVIDEIRNASDASSRTGGTATSALRLGVNRLNPAIKFYERLGFRIIREEKTDIGNGHVMDDYIMELSL